MIPLDYDGPFETERLLLRLPTLDDTDAVYAYQSREDVCEFLPYAPRSREEVAEKLERNAAITRLENDGDFWLLPLERRDDGRVIGEVMLRITSAALSGGEIGWVLHPDAHGKGYANEAARAVLELAFDRVALHRVVAELDPRNAASVALCARLGMREEAHFVKNFPLPDGSWGDTGIHAILAEEWRAAR
ncbi:RimJ/RimL family protein N-acetyltransferase [Diaminobutyricimonas aerilata]|uniref:RimJ/RimL family protein N-acetyltransferase n=1 Tax=Diaminobutyricimonas aerilata TaxID=1162967 RepID=A0A2M9CF75_9MICO|nr:GNAT family protein [Diaminobutyricimonas aerilata]PJJ70538.1 RimJ/RimL family protein N-acetyltransferase [Diaminobutyricimonas aerilata]